jgi:hypothetical protein
MSVDGVLDGQVVQIELARHLRELLGGGLMKAQPDQLALIAARSRELGDVVRRGDTLAVTVDGTAHDHRRSRYAPVTKR